MRRSSSGRRERLKRALAAEDFDAGAATSSRRSRPWRPKRASRGDSSAGLKQIGDSLVQDAYWRQAIWRRIVAIGAGPATNLVFARHLVRDRPHVGRRKGDDDGGAGVRRPPGARDRPAAGRPDPRDQRRRRDADRDHGADLGLERRPLTILARRAQRRRSFSGRCARQTVDEGIYRLGFSLGAQPLGAAESIVGVGDADRRLTGEIGKSLGNIVHKEGREQISSPIGIVDESS